MAAVFEVKEEIPGSTPMQGSREEPEGELPMEGANEVQGLP